MKGRLATRPAMVALFLVGAGHLGAGEPAGPAAADLVPVRVRDVKLDQATFSPLVVLETRQKDRILLVAIGHPEAMAILRPLRREAPLPRPMTHDLLKDVITRLGAKLDRMVVTRLEKGTFYAELIVRRGDTLTLIDCRPSDALALALRMGADIFVARAVLDEAGLAPDELPDEPAPRPPRRPPIDPDRAL